MVQCVTLYVPKMSENPLSGILETVNATESNFFSDKWRYSEQNTRRIIILSAYSKHKS